MHIHLLGAGLEQKQHAWGWRYIEEGQCRLPSFGFRNLARTYARFRM